MSIIAETVECPYTNHWMFSFFIFESLMSSSFNNSEKSAPNGPLVTLYQTTLSIIYNVSRGSSIRSKSRESSYELEFIISDFSLFGLCTPKT